MKFFQALGKWPLLRLTPSAQQIIWWAGLGLWVAVSIAWGISYYGYHHQESNRYFLYFYGLSIFWIFLRGHPVWPSRRTWGFIGLVALLYAALHLPIFHHAPWNENGLFDDAAWDIYLLKKNLFTQPWQTLYYDHIGGIAREYLFHYFMAVWLKVFGYSIKAFNYGLLFLGAWTVIFAALTVRIFWRSKLAFLAAVTMTLLPFHYAHQFIGHRYAIALPLLAAAIYFFVQANKQNESWYMKWFAVLLGLVIMSSIMGRQALYAAVVVGGLRCLQGLILRRPLCGRPRGLLSFCYRYRGYFMVAGIVLVVLLPHLLYIIQWPHYYFRREFGLIGDFFSEKRSPLISFFKTWLMLFCPCLGRSNYARFSLDVALMPYSLCALWGLGLFYLARFRQYWIIALNFIPILGSWVAGPYDFRFYFAVPAWFIALGMGLGALLRLGARLRAYLGPWPTTKSFGVLFLGLAGAAILLAIAPYGNRPLELYLPRRFYEHFAVWLLLGGIFLGWASRNLRPPALGGEAWAGISLRRALREGLLKNLAVLKWQYAAVLGVLLLWGTGLLDNTWQLLKVRQHPQEIFLMEHAEVGRARIMQDIIEGAAVPSPRLHRPHELKTRLKPTGSYFGVCSRSFGVVHLFLEQQNLPYDIFRFCQMPITLFEWHQLWNFNVSFWKSLNPMLAAEYVFMWDYTRHSRDMYKHLKALHPPGTLKMILRSWEGTKLQVFYLKMTQQEFVQWQQYLSNRIPLTAKDRP